MKLLKQLALCFLACTILTVNVFAFPDVTKDYSWAEPAIKKLSDENYINGYPDGTFRPAQNITRAEFAKLVTLIFGNKDSVSYQDVTKADWFYPYVSQSGGYFITAEKFFPNQNITRQEVAYALYIALELTDSSGDKSVPFRDFDQVDNQYMDAVKNLARNGLVTGYPDGSFGPEREITRAEIAAVLERAMNYEAPKDTDEELTEEEADLKANTYFFVVSRVSTVANEHGELITKLEGYQNGKLTTILLPEDVRITKSALADDTVIEPGDIISYYRNLFDEIRQVSIGMNANDLPRLLNRIEVLTVGNTTKRHIAVGTVKETYQQKGIELTSLVGTLEKLYEVNDPVHVYELKANGKIELSDFLEITDSKFETGDTVVAFSYDDVLYEILVIKE